MATPRIAELAQIITSQADVLNEHLRSNDLPEPSFSPEAPIDAFGSSTPDVQKAKTSVVEAVIELRQLLEGPVKLLLPEVLYLKRPAIALADNGTHSQTLLRSQQSTASRSLLMSRRKAISPSPI
jgi:hypothetical protein